MEFDKLRFVVEIDGVQIDQTVFYPTCAQCQAEFKREPGAEPYSPFCSVECDDAWKVQHALVPKEEREKGHPWQKLVGEVLLHHTGVEAGLRARGHARAVQTVHDEIEVVLKGEPVWPGELQCRQCGNSFKIMAWNMSARGSIGQCSPECRDAHDMRGALAETCPGCGLVRTVEPGRVHCEECRELGRK